MLFSAKADVLNGLCGASGNNLQWSLDTKAGVLVITGEGEMRDFEARKSPWFGKRNSIKSVKLPEKLSSIGNYAFQELFKLTSVKLP